MSDLNSYGFGQTGSISTIQVRNRVLRNTYALLALSMVPTVIGAWLGVAMGLDLFAGSPFLGFIVFMAVAFGFFWAIEKNKDTGVGVLQNAYPSIFILLNCPEEAKSNGHKDNKA